jgi:PAS domain S-box-containing protein
MTRSDYNSKTFGDEVSRFDKKELIILLIEDNPNDTLLIRHLIGKSKSLEIELLVAESLVEAQQRLAEQEFDLILLDLLLPDSHDFQTFNRLSQLSLSTPVIVLSGIKDRDVALQAIKDGAQDYLLKGEIDHQLLEKSIWYAVERNKLINERKIVTQELQAHERLLKLITRISTTFINLSSEQIDESISQALEMIGNFLEADRAFIYEITAQSALRCSYEWIAPSAHPEDSPANVPPFEVGLQNYGNALEELQTSGVFSLNTQEELADNHEFRHFLQAYQIESILLVAIFYEKKLTGIFGLSSRNPFKIWNEDTISLLNPSGEIFYRAIKKKQAEVAIKESEKQYRTLVENMNEGLVHVDAKGKIRFINDRVSQMLGFTTEELLGTDAINAIFFDESSRHLLLEKRQDRQKTRLPEQYEIPVRTKSNTIVWMLLNVHPIINGQDLLEGTMVTMVDISDRKKAEDKLKRVNQELKTFIYRASHDLRGPLASVLGLTNLAQMQIQDAESLKFFDYIRASTYKLDKTLKALTDVASITQLESFTEINFPELIEEVFEGIRESSEVGKEMQIDLQINQPVPFLSGREPIKYMLENIIDNSIKYRNPSHALKLRLNVNVTAACADIEVSDNGMGIPANLQTRVFDMFFRGNENSKGSGLGLYVVEKLAGSLNGNIRMTSEENVGTSLFIHLQNMG